MEEFWKRYDAFAAQLQELTGAAWHNLVLYKQAESIGYLAVGLVTLIIAIGLLVFVTKKLAPNWTYQVTFNEPMPERYEAGGDSRYPRESGEYASWKERRDYATARSGEGNPLTIFGSIGCVILSAILLLFFAGPNLLDIWNWIGAFVPEARLFHDIFEAIGPRVLPQNEA